jgi:hypothetical protein
VSRALAAGSAVLQPWIPRPSSPPPKERPGMGRGAALACARRRHGWPLTSSQAAVDPAPVAATGGGEVEDGMWGRPHLRPSLPPLVAAGLLFSGRGSRAPSPPPPEESAGMGAGPPLLAPVATGGRWPAPPEDQCPRASSEKTILKHPWWRRRPPRCSQAARQSSRGRGACGMSGTGQAVTGKMDAEKLRWGKG